MSIFENLTNYFRSRFKSPKQKEEKQRDLPKDVEEQSVLLDGLERKNSLLLNKKTLVESNSLRLRLFPSLYFSINLSLIVILLFLKFNNSIVTRNDIITKEYNVIPDYFDLYKVNTLIFHCYNIILSIFGFLITAFLFNIYQSQLIMQRKNELKYSYKLYMMVTFGILANAFLLTVSFTPNMSDNKIFEDFLTETQLRLDQFLFIIHIFFSILFALFSFCSLTMTDITESKSKMKWINFKLIVLIYLAVLTAAYVIILVFKSKLVALSINLEASYTHSLAFLPYLISVLNSLFTLTFYYETKEAKIYLGSILEAWEGEEKNTF